MIMPTLNEQTESQAKSGVGRKIVPRYRRKDMKVKEEYEEKTKEIVSPFVDCLKQVISIY